LADDAEVGIYKIAARLAEFILAAKIVANAVIGPRVAAGAIGEDRRQMQQWLTLGVRVAFFGGVVASLPLFFFGMPLLRLFGEGFIAGRQAMLILSVAHLINAASGSVAMALLAVRREHVAATGMGAACAINIILNYLLIPHYGASGAACATAVSMVLWNLIMVVMVLRIVGVNPTLFSRLRVSTETPS